MGFDRDNSEFAQTVAAARGGASGVQLEPRQSEKPVGKKPKPKSPSTTFLGNDAEPGPASGNSGGKTLLGM